MRLIIVFSAILILAGCGPRVLAITPEPAEITNYQIGETRRAAVGDPIFDVQTAQRIPMFTAVRDFQPPRRSRTQLSRSREIPAGTTFRAAGRTKEGLLILTSDSLADAVLATPDGVALSYAHLLTGDAHGPEWDAGRLFEESADLAGHPDAFRAQIIYSGVEGNSMRAVYREFAGDFMRPAFSQDLQYDLSESRTIAYRSIRIEVLRAGNTEIEYRVVDDGGLPWLPRD